MNLYLITRREETDWDTYSDAVVAAESEEQARDIHPGDGSIIDWTADCLSSTWAQSRENVHAHLIGTATEGTERGVICANFHAG